MREINIVDVEASGLHIDSYPIEVAIRLRNGHSKSWLIKPEPGWNYWSPIAESMHGISREKLFENGLPVAEVARQLNAFIVEPNAILYSDAYRWDENWIDTLYRAVKLDKPFSVKSIYDVMGVDKEDQFHKCFACIVESGNHRHHRAADDVQMIYEAYCRIME